ncbi:hypothetical protein IAT38_008415 [Cryptococcus sp. DSM 104549]
MRPSAPAQSGMPGPKTYIGWWGDMGSLPQKGIRTYGISPYRQRPLAGMLHGFLFNGTKRILEHLPYVAPPVLAFYGLYHWSSHKYAYYNSKQGHYDHLVEEGHIKPGEYERPVVEAIGH